MSRVKRLVLTSEDKFKRRLISRLSVRSSSAGDVGSKESNTTRKNLSLLPSRAKNNYSPNWISAKRKLRDCLFSSKSSVIAPLSIPVPQRSPFSPLCQRRSIRRGEILTQRFCVARRALLYAHESTKRVVGGIPRADPSVIQYGILIGEYWSPGLRYFERA